MNKDASRWNGFSMPFAACCVLILASLANFLVHNDYPLLRPEVFLLVAAVLAVGAAVAAIYVLLPRWGRAIVEGLLAALFVELNTTWLLLAILTGVAVAAVSLWKSVSLTRPMALFGAVVLITTLLGLGGRTHWLHSTEGKVPAAGADRTKPAIVHLILDEHTGIDGLPKDDPDAVRLRGELQRFYVGAGFATYGGAYSEYPRTVNAIPHILNYGERLGPGMRGVTAVIGPTQHLDRLIAQGYRVNVLQADYADFCSGVRFSACRTYESSSPGALVGAPLTTLERAGLITAKFLSLSQIADALLTPWRLVAKALDLPRLSPGNLGRSTSPPTFAALGELTRTLSAAQPGNVYFAHLLLPHYPYAFDADCRMLRWRKWEKPFTGRDLAKRQHAYYAQVRCTTRRIRELLAALDRSPAGRNNVVIIHGDHGSRITEVEPAVSSIGKFSDSDMVATYSTLFAVRPAQRAPGYSTQRLPVAQLLRNFAASGFVRIPSAATPPVPSVFLDGPEGEPGRRAALPRSWLQQGGS